MSAAAIVTEDWLCCRFWNQRPDRVTANVGTPLPDRCMEKGSGFWQERTFARRSGNDLSWSTAADWPWDKTDIRELRREWQVPIQHLLFLKH